MSDLQLALIAAGVAAVAGVWGYNKWQERQHRKLAENIFKGSQPDVLLGKESAAVEPSLGEVPRNTLEAEDPAIGDIAEPATAAMAVPDDEGHGGHGGDGSHAGHAGHGGHEGHEGGQGHEGHVGAAGAATLPPLPDEHADEIADCLVRMDFTEAVPAPALWSMQARWAGLVGKTMSWLGFDDTQGAWRRLSAHDAGRYRVVCAAVQLADRQGAVTDAGLSAFFDGVREIVGQCAGVAELPDQDEALVNARALDEFCASVDLQLGVNVITVGEAFAGTKLRGVTEAAGLRLLDDGSFHALDDAGMTRFTLSNIGAELFVADAMKSLATQGVTLSLDVPRVADGPAVFDAMMAVARQLAGALGGALVDAHGKPLSPEMVAGIRAKVGELQQRMAHHQIVAGGVRALRLFS